MNIRNHVQLIGRAGMPAEVRTLDGGRKVANFSIATTEYWTDGKGERKEQTEWHQIVAYGNYVDVIEKIVSKGVLLLLYGSLRTRKWTDKNGVDHWSTEIIVSQVLLIASKQSE